MSEPPSESTKSNLKQSYLLYSTAIENYKSRIDDLESSMEINRKLIYDLIHLKFQDRAQTTSNTHSSFPPKLFEQQLSENIQIDKQIRSVIISRNEAQSTLLLNQQIANEIETKLAELTSEYEEKINECNYNNTNKKKIIEELKRINSRLEERLSLGVQSMNVEVIAPSPEIINCHVEIENLKDLIQVSARNYGAATGYREKLLGFVKTTYSSCQKIQALLKNPVNRFVAHERYEVKVSEEISIESESASESSEIEISDNCRASTLANKAVVVPPIDFSKIHAKEARKSVFTLQNNTEVKSDTTKEAKEFKQIYRKIQERIVRYSEKLDKLCTKNKKLQKDNMELVKTHLERQQIKFICHEQTTDSIIIEEFKEED